MNRSSVLIAGLLVLSLLGLAGCGAVGSSSTAGTSAAYTQTMAVTRGNLVASITPTGEVYAPKQVELTFPANDLTVLEVHVAAGQYVEEGTVLARVDPTPLQRAVDQARADYLSAKKAWEEAQEPHTALDRMKAELAVAQAQTALEEAKRNLEEALQPDLEEARAAVEKARRQLQKAQDDLKALQSDPSVEENLRYLEWLANEAEAEHGRLLQNPNPSEEQQDRIWLARNAMLDAQDNLEVARARAALNLLNAQFRVTQAEWALADAEEALAELQGGPDPVAVAQAKNAVAQAEYNLAKAQEDLRSLLAGPDPDDLALAEARYKAAEAALAEAEADLEGATLRAPFAGTVLTVNVRPGDRVSSNQVAIVLADLEELRVLAYVDETEISQVERGQEVEVTFDAFPGRRFRGEVLEVPLRGELVGNVVTYEVPVSLEGTGGVPLKPGMTANLRVIVGRREGVLLVPTMALEQGDEGYVVRVVELDGGEVLVPVEVGLSDGTYTEVLRGLNEGDQVVIQAQAAQTAQRGPMTGGFGAFFGRFR